MKFIGKKVKMKRIEHELTQAQLAKKCNISTGTLSGIEKQNKEPNLKILLKIAKELKCSLDNFLKEE